MADVSEFARQKNLEHIIPQLQKGALLAQNPVCGDRLPVNTPD